MPHKVKHGEHHFRASETVRDIVIGMTDGLTVPFALAAGLSGVLNAPHVVVMAGLAEIAAGSIAMGLGGYLAARSDADHYAAEYDREMRETVEMPREERLEIEEIFRKHGLEGDKLNAVVDAITEDQNRWVDFMMRFELGLEIPDPTRAPISAGTIALSYIIGGLIPLAPYMGFVNIHQALQCSIVVTLAALFIFGFSKGLVTGMKPWQGGFKSLIIGGLAAAAAFGIAKLVS